MQNNLVKLNTPWVESELFQNHIKHKSKKFLAYAKKFNKDGGYMELDGMSEDDGEELADKMDAKDQENQRKKEATIKDNFNIWKKKFFNTYMIPIIQEFMNIYEASLVIDIDSKAFRLVIFDSRINITNSVIERMNILYTNIDEITQEITS